MTLRDLLTILCKRPWTMALVFVVFMAARVTAARIWPPYYTSQATLYLQSKRSTIDQALADNPTINRDTMLVTADVLSEVELLGSAAVRQLVIDQLDLAQDALVTAKPGEPEVDQRKVWDQYLYDNITAEAAANANVIEVTFDDVDPERAARVVSAYVDAYLVFRHQIVARDEGDVDKELELCRGRMVALEKQLGEFDETWKLVDAEVQKSEALDLHATIRAQATAVGADLELLQSDAQAYIDKLEANATELRQIGEVRNSPTIELLEGQVAGLELELSTLLLHSTEKHQPVQRIEKNIELVRADIEKQGTAIVKSMVFAKLTDVASKKAQLLVYTQMIATLERELDTLRTRSHERRSLQRQLDLAVDHFNMASRRHDQRVRQDMLGDFGDVNVVVASHGSVPGSPTFPPKLPLTVLIGVFVGLLLAVSSVIVMDWIDDKFTTPADVEERLDVAVLAVVPARRRHDVTHLLAKDGPRLGDIARVLESTD